MTGIIDMVEVDEAKTKRKNKKKVSRDLNQELLGQPGPSTAKVVP